MQKIINKTQKILSLLFSYKFNILAILYYIIAACYPVGSVRLVYILGACSLFFVHNLIAKVRFSYLWLILFSILITLNAYIAFIYGSYVGVGAIASILDTNITEATSVLSGIFLSIIVLLSLSTFLIYMSVKEQKKSPITWKMSALAIFIYCYALLPLCYRRILITELKDSYHTAPLYTMQVATNYYSPVFYGSVMTLITYFNEMYTFWQFPTTERMIPDGISFEERKEETVNKIFIVIGESATPSRMSLYGYSKKTTPFTDALYQADSSQLLFYNGKATASYTRKAVPAIVSTSNARNPILFYKEKNVLNLANEVGYKTFWISNQARMDLWSSKGNFIGNLAESANHVSITADAAFKDDFEMLTTLDNFCTTYKKEKQLYVIHLQGSHYHYANKFDSIDLAALPGNEGELSHMYDLSIHHTDRFLESIYKKHIANDSTAIMIYTSDHGEDVGMAFGHGIIPISAMQFEVPFIIYNKTPFNIDSIASKYIDEYHNLSNSNAIYILLETMGYSISQDVIKNAVEDGKYAIHDDKLHLIKNISPYTLTKQKAKE